MAKQSVKIKECVSCEAGYTITYDTDDIVSINDEPIICPFCGEVAEIDLDKDRDLLFIDDSDDD